MRKKMLFIFNPRSGKGMIRNKLLDIIDVFVKGGYEVIAHPTQEPKDAGNIAREFADEVDLIVCSGGDGTMDEVVSGLMEGKVSIPVGYIPAGSTNDFANSLEIPRDMIQAAQNIIDGSRYSVDVGSFNGDTFIYVAAFGLFTEVSYQTSQDLKNVLGHLAYLLEGAKSIFSAKAQWVEIEANGRYYEGEYIYGMITNSHSVGGFKNLIGPDVEMDDGLFEVTLIRKPENAIELNEILASLLNAVDTTELIDSFKADAIKIHSIEPIAWTLDGEFGGEHTDVEVENKKQALEVLLRNKEEKK